MRRMGFGADESFGKARPRATHEQIPSFARPKVAMHGKVMLNVCSLELPPIHWFPLNRIKAHILRAQQLAHRHAHALIGLFDVILIGARCCAQLSAELFNQFRSLWPFAGRTRDGATTIPSAYRSHFPIVFADVQLAAGFGSLGKLCAAIFIWWPCPEPIPKMLLCWVLRMLLARLPAVHNICVCVDVYGLPSARTVVLCLLPSTSTLHQITKQIVTQHTFGIFSPVLFGSLRILERSRHAVGSWVRSPQCVSVFSFARPSNTFILLLWPCRCSRCSVTPAELLFLFRSPRSRLQ